MTIDLTRFHESFFTESLEAMDATEAHLLALESAGDRDPGAAEERVNAIFRAVHSVKGAAGSLGFGPIGEFTHHLESFLDHARKGSVAVAGSAVDALLASVDHTRSLLKAARDGGEVDANRSVLLVETLRHLSPDNPFAPQAAKPSEADTAGPAQVTYRIRFEPSLDFFRSGNDPLRMFKVLSEMGTLVAKADTARLPAPEAFDPEACYLAWDLLLTTATPRGDIEEVFAWAGEESRVTIAVDTPAPAAAAAAPVVPERRASDERRDRRQADRRRAERRGDEEVGAELRTDRLHVSRDRVDELINLMGELVITKTMLKQAVSTLDPSAIERLEQILASLERNTRDLQDRVMSIRMLPMSHAFGRFARLVRDVGQRTGKQITLEITGGDAELDKSVIEKLVDPLTHLVRNALDHGIEAPPERKAAGKPEGATLKLHAEHKGGHIEIRVSDDGRGIDVARVQAKGREVGLLMPGETIDAERACELIFEPGFSTAAEVGELSGRGVGLDVVRKNILALAGTLRFESKPGRGAEVVLRLPLTLAIIDGMLVTIGADAYIVPMTSIVECLQPDPSTMKSIAGRGMLVELRGEYLPLLELARLTATEGAAAFEDGLLIVLEAEGNKVALLVDALVGQEQVVIKSLERNYRKVGYIAGATILGEGRVTLILDVASLVRAARE
ncbi:Chemotaxis protein CheA [Usitatibacter rugosus]|uniref:Chemotaxis protein CheA n=1 Tax=Usitatibacter rugosus TaxID=2732067 RepID=A0A6M4GWQ7_9PROT|nr:chemotaxis protein CheA [Usitatibacter rugosus]QJR10934.1 Chemotaxis protein CheA [Usitatibacter rugosus]